MYKHNHEAFYLIFKLQGQWKTLNVLNCFLFISHSALMFIHHFIIILKKIITKKGRRPRSFTIKWSDKNCIYLLLTWWWSSPLQAPSWRSEMLAKVWASSSCRSCQPRRPAGLQWQQAPWGTGRTGQALCRDRSVQVELCPLPSTAPAPLRVPSSCCPWHCRVVPEPPARRWRGAAGPQQGHSGLTGLWRPPGGVCGAPPAAHWWFRSLPARVRLSAVAAAWPLAAIPSVRLPFSVRFACLVPPTHEDCTLAKVIYIFSLVMLVISPLWVRKYFFILA